MSGYDSPQTAEEHANMLEDEQRTRERVERLVHEAEGLRAAAAWMLTNRRTLAELGVGDFSRILYGGADSDEVKFYLYGDDDHKMQTLAAITKAFPDMNWADDSTDTKIGIQAEIVGNYCVLFFGTRKTQ